MSIRFLAWYTAGVLSFASLLLLFISVAPTAQSQFAVMQGMLAGAALLFAAIGVYLTRLPSEHWIHDSIAVRFLLSVAAVASSLLVAAGVG